MYLLCTIDSQEMRVPILLFFLIITSLSVKIPICLSRDEEQYSRCGKLFQCGSQENIGYPFYGEGRPESCGYPGFELTCQRDVPFITIGRLTYRVLGINNTKQALTIARDDLWSNLCPTLLYNTTLDLIFSYGANVQNMTLYYGCSLVATEEFSLSIQFDCNANGTTGFGFMSYHALVSNLCSNNINVPVNSAALQGLANVNSSANDLRAALTSGFEVQWFANNTNCNRCTQSGGRCGYNSSSNSFVCYAGYNPRIAPVIIIIIAALGGTCAVAVFSITALYCFRRRRFLLSGCCNTDNKNIEVFMRSWSSFAPKQYSYSEIKKITNSFAEKLGQGGYGRVYKGKLPDGCLVAVKVLSETKGNGEEFINEVSSISKTSHVNIVTLLGFCYNRKRALIYEFIPNGSLDKFIYKSESPNANCHLQWKTLYQIAVGIARGLEYLHRGCNTRIVHFDIKPHNILLDEDFCPKISDFGLAKLFEKKESILSTLSARGTIGYIAPEVLFRHFGGVSHKSDVYSFGMMILEMVGVRNNATEVDRSSDVYFPQWIYEHLELGKDLKIQAVTGVEEEEISRKMILVGLWCIQTNPSDRPPIGKVVEMLDIGLDCLQIPPKPFLYFSKRSPQHSSASLES